MKRTFFVLAIVTCLMIVAPLAHADSLIIGATNAGGNAFPFGNNGFSYSGEYQQVYSGTAFSGPVDITSIAFSSMNAQNYSLSLSLGLSTTSAAVNGLSTNYASNKGTDFTTEFSGVKAVTALGNNSFDLVFNLASPFTFDPSKGNLLLDVFDTSDGAANPMFYNNGTDPNTSRVYNDFGNGTPTADSTGLETQFTFTPAAATPEPSSLILLSSVFALVGLTAVTRKLLFV
jgi:hypothetical protein